MSKGLSTIFLLVIAVSTSAATKKEPDTVSHYQFQSRYAFGEVVLKHALSYSEKPYQVIQPKKQQFNEADGQKLVVDGKFDIQWLSTSAKRERDLIPIRIPVYRGILGLRLLLATKEQALELKNIRTLTALRKYTGGHGAHWQDLPVYKANNLPVKAFDQYETIFEQLKVNSFDYFHRGINEIWPEYEQHKDSLSVVDNLMLFYDHPVYFFVTKKRPQLASDIEKGLKKALKDGTFKKIFLDFHNEILEKSNLSKRTLIFLNNPVLTRKHSTPHWKWWLNTNSSAN